MFCGLIEVHHHIQNKTVQRCATTLYIPRPWLDLYWTKHSLLPPVYLQYSLPPFPASLARYHPHLGCFIVMVASNGFQAWIEIDGRAATEFMPSESAQNAVVRWIASEEGKVSVLVPRRFRCTQRRSFLPAILALLRALGESSTRPSISHSWICIRGRHLRARHTLRSS